MTIRSLAQGLNENIEVDQHIFFFLPVLSSSVEFDELSAVVDIPDEGAVPAKNKCEGMVHSTPIISSYSESLYMEMHCTSCC